MGYITKDIALISEAKRISLTGVPNFVQFKPKPAAKTFLKAIIPVVIEPGQELAIQIIEPSGIIHLFAGTYDAQQATGATFYIDEDNSTTAENLRQAMLYDKWVATNFEILNPMIWQGNTAVNGDTLELKSKGAGAAYNIDISGIPVTWINVASNNNDSIAGEAATVEVSLDVFIDPAIFLGADDRPLNSAAIGTQVLSLSKTYAGQNLWFDVSAPFSGYMDFKHPAVSGWFDTGTIRAFTFAARVLAGGSNSTFYQSGALYSLRGYADDVNLEEYIYAGGPVKLLTRKPRTPYIKGQTEYINFILSDPDHGTTFSPNWTLEILYRAYDTLGNFIGQVQSDAVTRNALHMVNTCVLRIDDLLALFPSAGVVKVSLVIGSAIISNDLEYLVRPAPLHARNEFSFLNALGGWDTFNFDAPSVQDMKSTHETFSRTVTPEQPTSVDVVYSANVETVYTVTGAPVTDEVANWLTELARSTVVLDSEGRYITKIEFTTPISEGVKNMQTPTLKYRYE